VTSTMPLLAIHPPEMRLPGDLGVSVTGTIILALFIGCSPVPEVAGGTRVPTARYGWLLGQ
jgi:hypothetical protein